MWNSVEIVFEIRSQLPVAAKVSILISKRKGNKNK